MCSSIRQTLARAAKNAVDSRCLFYFSTFRKNKSGIVTHPIFPFTLPINTSSSRETSCPAALTSIGSPTDVPRSTIESYLKMATNCFLPVACSSRKSTSSGLRPAFANASRIHSCCATPEGECKETRPPFELIEEPKICGYRFRLSRNVIFRADSPPNIYDRYRQARNQASSTQLQQRPLLLQAYKPKS